MADGFRRLARSRSLYRGPRGAADDPGRVPRATARRAGVRVRAGGQAGATRWRGAVQPVPLPRSGALRGRSGGGRRRRRAGITGRRSRSGSACCVRRPGGHWPLFREEDRPAAFYRAWTRMEACVKAAGTSVDLGVARLETFLDRAGAAPPVVPTSAGKPLALPRSHRVGGVRRRPGAFRGDNGAKHLVGGSGKTNDWSPGWRVNTTQATRQPDGGLGNDDDPGSTADEQSPRASSSTRPACRTSSPPGPGRIRTRWR